MFTVLSPSRTDGGAEQQIKAWGGEGDTSQYRGKSSKSTVQSRRCFLCVCVDESVRHARKSCKKKGLKGQVDTE